jgi:hypothetical protein
MPEPSPVSPFSRRAVLNPAHRKVRRTGDEHRGRKYSDFRLSLLPPSPFSWKRLVEWDSRPVTAARLFRISTGFHDAPEVGRDKNDPARGPPQDQTAGSQLVRGSCEGVRTRPFRRLEKVAGAVPGRPHGRRDSLVNRRFQGLEEPEQVVVRGENRGGLLAEGFLIGFERLGELIEIGGGGA